MHERSIAKNLLNIVLDKISKYGKQKKIKKISIVVGEFTMIHEELLVSAFYQLSQSTIAEGAKIKIVHSPLKAKCHDCQKEFNLNKEEFRCFFCDSQSIQIISGEELFIKDIELTSHDSN